MNLTDAIAASAGLLSELPSGVTNAAKNLDLVGAGAGGLVDEIDEKVDRIPANLNEFGYDPWGYNPEAFKLLLLPAAALHRGYFRAKVTGTERLPEGKMLLIGNHAGQMAFDGLMILTSLVLDADPPRLGRGMGEYWLGTLPWMSTLVDRMGSSIGTPKTCVDMLNSGEAVLAFPEGVRGMNKLYRDAYKLMEFGLGFMRLALETDAPIVPVSIVGSEEQQPGIANLDNIGRMLGMPAFPITPTFPLLGPLGLLPLPVRYHIEFGEPMQFEGDPDDDDEVIVEKVQIVRDALQAQLQAGLARRESIFL